MNYEMIMNSLREMTPQERLYFEAATVMPMPDKDTLAEKYPVNPFALKLACQEDDILDTFSENFFIPPKQNIAIVKHYRYMPLHRHKHVFFEILYVLSGHCVQYIADTRLELHSGDMCLIAPDTFHAIEPVFDDTIMLNLLIRKSTFLDIFFRSVRDKSQLSYFFLGNMFSNENMKYLIFHTNDDPYIRTYILDMYIEQIYEDEYSDSILCGMMMIFFTQLIRRHRKGIELPKNLSENTAWAIPIIDYIAMNYADATLSKTAKHFHFSVSYMSKLIKRASGTGFHELLTSVRMQHAHNYLTSTNFTIEQISERLGYSNPETFTRVFSKYYHISPSQYRMKHMGRYS